MDAIRHGLDHGVPEHDGALPVGCFRQARDDELRGPVDGHEQMELALASAELGEVDVEEPDRERTKAGLQAARAGGRRGGRPNKMTPAKLRLARAAMGQPDTKVGDLCEELGITRQTLYRFVSPAGELRDDRKRLPEQRKAVRT